MDTIRTQRHQRLIELLIIARKRAGIRQADLARRIGKTQTFVARIEAGERRIDTIELLAICKIIGINPLNIIRKLLKLDDELWKSPIGSNPRRRRRDDP